MLFSRSHKHYLLIHFCALIPFFFHLTQSQGNICHASIPTIRYVNRCPSTKLEWDTAAKQKKCFYVGQNCTNTAKFKYHCLMNSNETLLLEVCTIEWLLNGYCPIFYEKDAAIDNNFNRDCKEYEENSCPGQYNSTQAYKYRRCYVLKSDSSSTSPVSKARYSQTVTTPTISSSSTIARLDERSTTEVLDSQNPFSTNTWISIVITLSCILVAAVVGLLIFCIVTYRRKKHGERGMEDEIVPLNVEPAVAVNSQIRGVEEITSHNTYMGEHVQASSVSDGEYITAAIDIGAVHTKWAFAYFVSQSCDGHHPQITTHAEESVILFDKNKTFISFGSKAVELYLRSNNPQELYFIRNFTAKSSVPLKQDMRRWHAADQKGRNIPLLEVYAETIKFIKNNVKEMAEKSFPKVTKFRWILTFPAIWEEAVAKEFLTEAANKAGITVSNRCLTTEHGSASEWHFSVCQSKAQYENSKCLFVDLGGGSIKIYTEHKKKGTLVISEPKSGGITLLKEFEQCLKNVFGGDVIEAYKTNQREDYFKLFSTFMKLIHEHKLSSPDNVSFDAEKIITVYETAKSIDINNSIEKCGVCLRGGKLQIPHEKLLTFFETCKAQIQCCIDAAIENLPEGGRDIKVHVFGGFSNSDIIFQYVTKAFQSSSILSIYKIQDSEMAIVKGAVLHGGSDMC